MVSRTLAGVLMHKGFTLIELVVVILILGILAGVAVPRLNKTTESAAENQVKQSLCIVRDVIERFKAANGRAPGANGSEATFKADLAIYLRKFPVVPVGPAAARDDSVAMDDKLSPIKGDNNPTEGWRYFYTSMCSSSTRGNRSPAIPRLPTTTFSHAPEEGGE